MKHILLIWIALVCLSSCKDDNDMQLKNTTDEVLGQWKLIEFYADPGDGSGDFQQIESEKRILFMTDGTVSSNANLCILFSEVGETSTGTFSEEDMSISISGCDISTSSVNYEMVGSQLIVSYFCIEGCLEKYEKIE